MEGKAIKQKSNWPAVDLAIAAFTDSAIPDPSLYTALADRLRAAIEAPGEGDIDKAASILEDLFREATVRSPDAVRGAARGTDSGSIALAYALGKIAFAQLVAARAARSRADGRFYEHIRDPRYRPYIEALSNGPLSGTQLKEKVGTRLETVSRKLAVLRELGIVLSRKQGNIVENILTPAARGAFRQMETPMREVTSDVPPKAVAKPAQRALKSNRDRLPNHLQNLGTFGVPHDAEPARRKVA